jgi:hypothetical protein
MPATQALNSSRDARLLLAIQAFHQHEFSSIRATARAYDVPYTSLHASLNGRHSKHEKAVLSRKLRPTEEATLIRWLLSMDNRGFGLHLPELREMAYVLLSERGDTPLPNIIGKNWASNFIKRHNELKMRFTRKYDYKRAKCEDPKVIQEWFQRVIAIQEQYGIAYKDVYNFDETGFAMGVAATSKVITSSDRVGRAPVVQPGNREWVTSIECVNAMGWSIPPYLIFAGKRHISAWFQDLPKDWIIALSENGWTTDQLGLYWLINHFEPHTKTHTIGQFRLLILDGHTSHVNAEFDRFCEQHHIVPLCMPAHTSHLLQPLDVGVFSPLKRAYGLEIQSLMRLGINHIDKEDFIATYSKIRPHVITQSNIQSGFRATGLIPLDSDAVLSKLKVQIRSPSPLAPTTTSPIWQSKTPANIHQLAQQASLTKRLARLNSISPPSPMVKALEQIQKGAQLAMHEATLLASENKRLREANEHQVKKRAAPRQQLAGQLAMTAGQAAELIGQRNNSGGRAGRRINEGTQQAVTAPLSRCASCNFFGHNTDMCPIAQLARQTFF